MVAKPKRALEAVPDYLRGQRSFEARAAAFEHDGQQYRVVSWSLLPADALAELSPAETHIATLIVAGHSNSEIARIRKTKSHTVGKQVSALYAKLGVFGRADLAAYCAGTWPLPSERLPSNSR